MCTVSIVQSAERLRLVVNRDEQRSRPLAQPPRIVQFSPSDSRERVRAAMPIDPASGGSWVAVNDAGLAAALLNANRDDRGQAVNREWGQTPPGSPARSRGEIVPRLAALTSLEAMVDAARAIDRARYQPFRLVCTGAGRAVLIDPHLDFVQDLPVAGPLMFTSSGLGDDVVEGPRRRLFADLVLDAAAPDQESAQDRFHGHRWESMPQVSVFMSRSDASTVSRTIVEIEAERLRMIYAAAPGWRACEVELARQSGVPRDQREDRSR